MYYCGTNQYIIKFNTANSTSVQSATACGNVSGIICPPSAIDGTYLYGSSYVSPSATIARFKLSDLSLMDNKNIVNITNAPWYVYSQGVVMIGGVLYVMSSSSNGGPIGTYSVDYKAGKGTWINSFYAESTTMFSDGTNIYTSYTVPFYAPSGQGTSGTMVATNSGGVTGIKNYNLMARKLLGTPITKTSSKTMKIIYEFTFS